MQEECDFQSSLMEKKLSAEARLDTAASSITLSETEIKKSIPKDSSVDFDVLSASSLDVLTKMGVELQKNESASEEQALATASTPEPIPEVDNDDDSNWLSYFDCNAIFDVTYENQSYYNSTKAEKDSDSDLDDTLTFDDAEEGEALVLDENDTYPNSYQQSFEETCEKKLDNNNFVVSDKASILEINQDSPSVAENIDSDQGAKEGEEKDRNGDNLEARDSTDRIDENANDNETSARIESMTIEKIEEVSSREDESNVAKETIIELKKTEGKMDDFSSDSEDEYEGNLIYSSPNVNISAYFKYRDSMKEPKYEATIDQLNAMYSKESSKSVILEEIVEEPCVEEAGKNSNGTANGTNEGECLKVREELKQGQEEVKEGQEELKQEEQKEGEGANLTGSAIIIAPDQRRERSKFVELNSPEEYLEKLAEITEPDCPRTEEEAHEKLKKIAEGKAEIENRKNEALEDLSVEFDKIEKLVAETKSANQAYDESGSDESSDEAKEGDIDVGKDIELPLTKDQVAESFKFKTVQKSVEEEEKRRAELLQECLQVIPKIPETEESVDEDLVAIGGVERDVEDVAKEKVEGDGDEDTGTSEASKEKEKEGGGEGEEGGRANEAIVDEASAETKSTVQGIVQDIIDETEDSLFWRFKKEPERTYIKGKVYDFDEKKHGARYSCLEPVPSVDAFTSACT
ncbi:uncharacterized protein PF11_0207-like [Apis laboriosa]|uniref:uncharacterized protein PF11_0207-like n=1 Tax=Apis laboriosa TaxID=183418 RepID=UPI001CC57B79|nr:uncharacterized protein PF11_0207-like [Apis laboriosa]